MKFEKLSFYCETNTWKNKHLERLKTKDLIENQIEKVQEQRNQQKQANQEPKLMITASALRKMIL